MYCYKRLGIIWCVEDIGDIMPICGITSSQTSAPAVVNPIITYVTYSAYWAARIQNKNSTAVTIYENADITPPTTSRGTNVAYNSTVNGDNIQKIKGGTWYAFARVTGTGDSNIVSITMDPDF